MQPAFPAHTAAPTKGTANCAQEGVAKPRGIIASFIEAARRQETLIDALTAAVDSGSETAIVLAAKELAANRRKETPAPAKKPGRKPTKVRP